MSDEASISEIAKKLGLQRTTLSKILSQQDVKRRQVGRQMLVSFADAQAAVQYAASQGRLKVTDAKKRDNLNQEQKLIEVLERELREVKERERVVRQQYEEAVDKIESLIHLDAQVKLLKSANDNLQQELQTIKSKNGLVGRIGKAIEILRKGE